MVLSFIVGFWVILMVILLWMCSSIISSEQFSSKQLLLAARGPESELGIVSSFRKFSSTSLVSFLIELAHSDLINRVKQGRISGKGLWFGLETSGIWCSRRRVFSVVLVSKRKTSIVDLTYRKESDSENWWAIRV